MSIKIILGAGYGDEGKGLATDFFAQTPYSATVRFNGGPQAGHTVITPEGHRHVFSHIGSGAFRRSRTIWSYFCPVSPGAFINELNVLHKTLGYKINPLVYIDPLCPVITPWDIQHNRNLEIARDSGKHGSVGVGFGTTIERHQNTPYKLFAQDLAYPVILKEKLKQIIKYYKEKNTIVYNTLDPIDQFLEHASDFCEETTFCSSVTQIANCSFDLVFEGAQGILLDQDHGIFPHVTRSNTTMKNAIELLCKANRFRENVDVYYMSRTYRTRHGAGPLALESQWPQGGKTYLNETNQLNPWQGDFRYGKLTTNQLTYAVEVNESYIDPRIDYNPHWFVTCCDHEPLPENIFPVFVNNRNIPISLVSNGPTRNDVRRYSAA